MIRKSMDNKKHAMPLLLLILMVVFILIMSATADGHVAYAKTTSGTKNYFSKVYPDKTTVSVINKTMRRWLKNYKVSTTRKYYKKGEASRPAKLYLSWRTGKGFSGKYTVKISTDKHLKRAVCYKTGKKRLEVRNLLTGTQYYWQISGKRSGKTVRSKIYSFRTAATHRLMHVSKVSNIRDIGGHTTDSGKRVVQGKIFRSGNMDDISKNGKKTMLKKLKIRTDLDLRRIGQGFAGIKRPLGSKAKYVQISGVMYEELWKNSGRKGTSKSPAVNRKTLVKEMKVFADKKNYPVLFHCIYGSDRTGTLAFTLEALLGMKKEDIYKDYEMTFFSKVSNTRNIDINKRTKRFIRLYDYMANYSDPEKSLSENTEIFLIDNGMTADEVQKIKNIMLR